MTDLLEQAIERVRTLPLLDGISETSPNGARRILVRIQAAADRLLDQPRSGPPTHLRPLRFPF